MAKLLSYFTLLNDTNEFLGLSEDCQPGCIINTLGRNIVSIIKLSNQNQTRSWTVLDKLSNKVVFDFKSNKYVGIFNNRSIRCWDQTDVDINKIKKIKLEHTISDIYSFERKNSIVLYCNGTCESLENSMISMRDPNELYKTMDDIINPDEYFIINAAYFITFTKKILFTYFIKNLKTNSIELIYYQITEDTLMISSRVSRVKLSRDEQKVKLVGYSIVDGAIVPSLITIWSDNRIFKLQLRDDDTLCLGDGNHSQKIYIDDVNTGSGGNVEPPGDFTSMINIFNMQQPLSVSGIGIDCMIIYGANAIQEGASIVTFNTQFNTIQSKQFFKVYFNNPIMWIIQQQIFLAVGQHLAVISFKLSKELLSDLIGSQRNQPQLQHVIDKDSINEDCELEESLIFVPTGDVKKITNIKSPNIVLSSSKQRSKKKNKKNLITYDSVDNFNNNFKLLLQQNLNVDIVLDDNSNINKKRSASDSLEVQKNIDVKICTNKKEQPLQCKFIDMMVNDLERNGACELDITNKIFPIMIKSQLDVDIATCLRKYSNISERILVHLIKYSIDNTNWKLISLILSCSFASELIIRHLRNILDFNDALFLLNHIYNILNDGQLHLEKLFYNDDDEDVKLFNWFTVIIDAHYQQFIICRNPRLFEILKKYQTFIETFINHQDKLKTTLSLLYNLVNGKRIGRSRNDLINSKYYNIELVKLY